MAGAPGREYMHRFGALLLFYARGDHPVRRRSLRANSPHAARVRSGRSAGGAVLRGYRYVRIVSTVDTFHSKILRERLIRRAFTARDQYIFSTPSPCDSRRTQAGLEPLDREGTVVEVEALVSCDEL